MKLSYMELVDGIGSGCASPDLVHTSIGTFHIQATVHSECQIDSASNLDFGIVHNLLENNIDGVSTITLICNGSDYRVSLSDGLHVDNERRCMRGADGYIYYDLYRDTQRLARWGSGYNAQMPGTGNGQPQHLTVYGRVPAQELPGTGLFSDTVVVTLSY